MITLSHNIGLKVKITNQLLHQFEGILWLDSDAIIHNPQKLLHLIKSTDTFLMSGDNPFLIFVRVYGS